MLFDQSFLEELGLSDSTERELKTRDKVLVRCHICGTELEMVLGNVLTRFKKKGNGALCNKCFGLLISKQKTGKPGPKNVIRKDGWTLEKFIELTGEFWELTKYELPLRSLQKVTCKCKTCQNPQTKTVKKFIEGLQTQTKGCTFCHANRTKSKSFSEERQEVAKKFMSNPENRKKWSELLKKRWEEDREGMIELSTNSVSYLSRSKEEKEVEQWIHSLGVECEHTVEYDIVCKEQGIAIEYNGLYWHSEKFKEKNFHISKTERAKQKGLRLIHIWSDEWAQNKEAIKNLLESSLSKNPVRIGARKCIFEEIDKEHAFRFLKETHIQGRPHSALVCLGCFYDKELIGVCTFSEHHRGKDEKILSRLSFKSGYTVSGALSKFSKLGSQKLNSDIFTWVDLCISDGSSYLKSGWTIIQTLPPDYSYTDNKVRISKQSRKKSNVNTPEEMTEREHAILDGLIRIWDCGKLKLKYKKPEERSSG